MLPNISKTRLVFAQVPRRRRNIEDDLRSGLCQFHGRIMLINARSVQKSSSFQMSSQIVSPIFAPLKIRRMIFRRRLENSGPHQKTS